MSIIVTVSLATICFAVNGITECHPALLGIDNSTPTGEYTLSHRSTPAMGYGGDILQFHETPDYIYALHRVWTLKPKEDRLNRLSSSNINDRFISSGCINVAPIVYSKILKCCSDQKLIIKIK